MLTNWLLEAEKINAEIRENRHHIHMYPELGNKEFKTADFVEQKLRSYGIRTERLLDTAVIAYLDTDAVEPCVALRADMDALPISEETGCGYVSKNQGCMHACGHDVHVSSALGAARLLCEHRNELKGSVRFIFQPDEENNGGASRLISLGAMKGVKAIFGMHVSPDLEFGDVGIRYGKFYASSDKFRINIDGKTAHGAEPQNGIDALLAAAQITIGLHKIPEELKPEKAILNVGTFESGTAENILPGHAYLTGIFRTFGQNNREYMARRLKEAVDKVCLRTGVKANVNLIHGFSGITNTDHETKLAEKALTELLGTEHIKNLTEPIMLSEDFGYYIEASSGSFYHLGVGGKNHLHSSLFLPPENAPVLGAAIHAQVISRYLDSII